MAPAVSGRSSVDQMSALVRNHGAVFPLALLLPALSQSETQTLQIAVAMRSATDAERENQLSVGPQVFIARPDENQLHPVDLVVGLDQYSIPLPPMGEHIADAEAKADEQPRHQAHEEIFDDVEEGGVFHQIPIALLFAQLGWRAGSVAAEAGHVDVLGLQTLALLAGTDAGALVAGGDARLDGGARWLRQAS
jgi:hypothetical protein